MGKGDEENAIWGMFHPLKGMGILDEMWGLGSYGGKHGERAKVKRDAYIGSVFILVNRRERLDETSGLVMDKGWV